MHKKVIADHDSYGDDIKDIVESNDAEWYCQTDHKKSTFPEIDRKQEDTDVDTFQKTNDISLFEKVYYARIPTLKYWARKYSYLMDSRDDMFGEFTLCFTKSVFTYKKPKGPFNTYLFRLLLNCIQNLQTGRKAKKRVPKGVDPNAMGKILLSLDYPYDSKDGTGSTLKDIVADKMASKDNVISKMVTDETLEMISGKNQVVKGFLRKLSNGNTIASLLKEYKTRHGKIHISKSQARSLHGQDKRTQKKMVAILIADHDHVQGIFSVTEYSIDAKADRILYTIEMKKTAEADLVMKTIRRLRKDKKNIISKLSR